MAFSDAVVRSFVAATTFSSTDLYKFVVVATSQDNTVISPDTTGNVFPVGTLYGVTPTTNAAGLTAVPVAVSGAIKVQMAASTLAAGQWVASDTGGLGAAPTTDAYSVGIILKGSSGAAGRIVTIQKDGIGPLSTP